MIKRSEDFGKNIKIKIVGDGYEVAEDYVYYSERYNRYLTIPKGMYSDGATCARDLRHTDAWLIHDHICRYGKWDDSTLINNFVASTVLAIELWKDGYKKESFFWWWATYLLGGGAARTNGMRIVTRSNQIPSKPSPTPEIPASNFKDGG